MRSMISDIIKMFSRKALISSKKSLLLLHKGPFEGSLALSFSLSSEFPKCPAGLVTGTVYWTCYKGPMCHMCPWAHSLIGMVTFIGIPKRACQFQHTAFSSQHSTFSSNVLSQPEDSLMTVGGNCRFSITRCSTQKSGTYA